MTYDLIKVLTGPLVEIIDQVFTNETERAEAKALLLKMELQPYLAQLEVNKAEAQNPNAFTSGWRPFIGWVCGIIFAWHFIVSPFITWAFQVTGVTDIPIPTMDVAQIMPVLLGMLGLGGLRSYEKYKGVEARR